MRRIMVLAAIGSIALGTPGCTGLIPARRDFSLTAPWDSYQRIEVRTRNGAVEVRSASVDEIHVMGTKRVRGYTLVDAEANLDQLTVHAGADAGRPGTFLIELRFPQALRYQSPGASIVVEVPEPCAATVKTGNGSIRVEHLQGEVVLDTSNGSVHVVDVAGSVRADTSNGRIEAEDVTGNLSADSSNGRIVARRIQGDCVLDSSNGDVHLEDAHGNIEINTSNGDIRLVAVPLVDGRLVLRTSNGSIHATVPETLAADLELTTSNGRVRTELGAASFQHLDLSKRRFKAIMNGGGCKVVATTSNGSITLDSR